MTYLEAGPSRGWSFGGQLYLIGLVDDRLLLSTGLLLLSDAGLLLFVVRQFTLENLTAFFFRKLLSILYQMTLILYRKFIDFYFLPDYFGFLMVKTKNETYL